MSDRNLVGMLRSRSYTNDRELRDQAADEIERLYSLLDATCQWFDDNRPQWGRGTLPMWYVDATLEGK